ncbi:MAG: sulfotransferase [bacterium]|nr:sulfotransferase [bacterium]
MVSESNQTMSPIVVIGAHRSGTSLVASLLARAGVFMGADQHRVHSESEWFLGHDKWVFHIAHARWDVPLPVRWLLEDDTLNTAVEEGLRQRVQAFSRRAFLGWRGFISQRSLWNMNRPWGFKDPRATFTLPMWLRLFPGTRVVHVVRNGIDVAESLLTRERRRRLELENPARSALCLNLERSYGLWIEYVEEGHCAAAALGAESAVTVRYEDLLMNPLQHIAVLRKFVGLPHRQSVVEDLAAGIDSGRAFAFRSSAELRTLYEERCSDRWMKAYGYDRLPPGSSSR